MRPNTATTSWRAFFLAAIGLLAVTLITHGPSLWDGLFFDDHWHRVTLTEYGWGFSDLVESATFDLPGRLTNLWWQEQPLQWRYARPVAMLAMKLELLLSGGDPLGVHAFALLWHWGTGLLVFCLAAWALRRPGWAFVAAAVFLFNPHSAFGVSWIAARNALVGGFFFVAAVLAYTRASFVGSAPRRSVWNGWLPVALVLWGLAQFSRETGIIFPLVAVALDVGFGGWPHARRRWPVYVLLAVLTIMYLYWRLIVFPTSGVPDIYFTAPSGLAYLPWAASKLLHMLFSQVFFTPMFLGLATYGGVTSSHVWTYLVMALVVGLFAWWYVWAAGRRPGRWVWPIWMVAAFVPVIPVFVMPHFSYLPVAAYAIMVAVMLSRLRGRRCVIVSVLLIGGILWPHFLYRAVWRGIVRSEQLVYADILDTMPPPPPGSKLFFIDLPVAGIYAPVALREKWGVEDLDGYVLSFAPHPLMMRTRTTIDVLNDHELLLTTQPPGYFAGLAGRMLLEGMRPGHPLTAGAVIPDDEFDTTVVERNVAGVTRLKFAFHQPLNSDRYCFFVSTPERPAARLRFTAGGRAELLPQRTGWRQEYGEWLAARDLYFRIIEFTSRIVKSDVVLTGGQEEVPTRESDE